MFFLIFWSLDAPVLTVCDAVSVILILQNQVLLF